MNSEHPEYNRDTNPYPSFGKKYNSERGIISLTSWKARINTVSKTLFSLLKQCPGFHIVLVLSEEEFPKMMDELPEHLKVFAENELIEILWVYKNYKSFKKVLFTMDKYRDVPVISADDDCLYRFNYANELYNKWETNKDKIISESADTTKYPNTWGYSTLYPPHFIKLNEKVLSIIHVILQHSNHDDAFYKFIRLKKKCKFISFYRNWRNVVIEHNAIKPVRKTHYQNEESMIEQLVNKLY